MRNLFILLTLCLCAGCVKDNIESIASGQDSGAKIIRNSDNIIKSSIIINFEDQAISRVEAGVTRSEATRSGIADFDEVLDSFGAISVKRVFPIGRFEERMRAEGLHRWYVVNFADQVDIQSVATQLSSVAEVAVVQFNTRVERTKPAADNTLAPVAASSSASQLAASPYPAFNDPELGRQWHYINTGDTSVFTGAKAGADINLGEAWKITAGDNRIVVAVVDGFVKYDHPDLQDNMWINTAEQNGKPGVDDDNNGYVDDIYGVDFCAYAYDQTTTPKDEYNLSDHGTHVAGTVAAVNNNGKGVCGVAGGTGKGDGVRLMCCQVFHEIPDSDPRKGSGWKDDSDESMALAYAYAADNGAAIAQCSWGYVNKYTSDSVFTPQNNVVRASLDYFVKYGGGDVLTGGLPIFAAGNEMYNYTVYPGAYRDYISVTSMSCDYTPAYYTNYGPGATLAAPGGDFLQKYWTDQTGQMNSEVYSTAYVNGVYDFKQGTSMACPHVSGIAALAIAHSLKLNKKKMTAIELRNLLVASTHDIDRYCVGTKASLNGDQPTTVNLAKFKGKMGMGYIDAFKALMNVQGTPCITVRMGVKQSIDLSDAIGGNPSALTFLDGGVTMSQEDRTRLGVDGAVTISSTGKLSIKCNKPGSAIIKISFIAGGDTVGSNQATGGMAITREIAIFSRSFATNGGWL